MKKQFFSFLVLLSLALCASAQNNEAWKFDDYGNTNCDDYRARLDNLLTELNNSPDSKGYVLVYEGDLEVRSYDKKGKFQGNKIVRSDVGTAKEVIIFYRNHLFFRRFPSERIVFVEAGFREKYSIQLWVVPNGADAPKPLPTLKKLKQRKKKPSRFGFCGEM